MLNILENLKAFSEITETLNKFKINYTQTYISIRTTNQKQHSLYSGYFCKCKQYGFNNCDYNGVFNQNSITK